MMKQGIFGKKIFHLQQNSNEIIQTKSLVEIDPSLSTALVRKRANQSVALASSDQGLTTTQLYAIKTLAVFSDFCHFQAGSADFELVTVKC